MTGAEHDRTASDLAAYPLGYANEYPGALGDFMLEHGPKEIRVGEVIALTCAVGHGGHYLEVLDESQEGEVLDALAEFLAPKYNISTDRAYHLLAQVRYELGRRLTSAAEAARQAWAATNYLVEVEPHNPDVCPLCGKRIGDFDEVGCEDSNGQRWCVEHALDALAAYRRPGRRAT